MRDATKVELTILTILIELVWSAIIGYVIVLFRFEYYAIQMGGKLEFVMYMNARAMSIIELHSDNMDWKYFIIGFIITFIMFRTIKMYKSLK
jgi:hypothetical protein